MSIAYVKITKVLSLLFLYKGTEKCDGREWRNWQVENERKAARMAFVWRKKTRRIRKHKLGTEAEVQKWPIQSGDLKIKRDTKMEELLVRAETTKCMSEKASDFEEETKVKHWSAQSGTEGLKELSWG
jgi:hypothetical protein